MSQRKCINGSCERQRHGSSNKMLEIADHVVLQFEHGWYTHGKIFTSLLWSSMSALMLQRPQCALPMGAAQSLSDRSNETLPGQQGHPKAAQTARPLDHDHLGNQLPIVGSYRVALAPTSLGRSASLVQAVLDGPLGSTTACIASWGVRPFGYSFWCVSQVTELASIAGNGLSTSLTSSWKATKQATDLSTTGTGEDCKVRNGGLIPAVVFAGGGGDSGTAGRSLVVVDCPSRSCLVPIIIVEASSGAQANSKLASAKHRHQGCSC